MTIDEFQELKNKITFRWTANTLRQTFFWPQGVEEFSTASEMYKLIFKKRIELEDIFEIRAACYAFFVACQYEECYEKKIKPRKLLQKINNHLNMNDTASDYQYQMYNKANAFSDFSCVVIYDYAKEFAQLPEEKREEYLVKLATKGQESEMTM